MSGQDPRGRETILDDADASDNGRRPPGEPPAEHAVARARPWYRRPLPLAVALVVAVAAVIGGAWYLRYAMTHESTDDAFIQAHVVGISPRVASDVARVLVDDNSHVNKGDLLVLLDPRDFEARVAQARANLAAGMARLRGATINVRVVDTTSGAGVSQASAGVETAARRVEGATSHLDQARARVAAAQAEATRAAADVQRYERLLQYGAVSRQERDNAVAANRTASANLDAAREAEQAATDVLHQTQSQVAEARARLASAKAAPEQVEYSRAQAEQAKADIAQLEAALHQALLDLSYAKIYAPESGRITRKSVEPGDYVQVGQTLFSIVPDRVWVIANFKETQLRYMRPGQPVTIRVDAYPDKVLKGHVDSVQAGSGAAFSLLPPENATGNYVKVVQRVPVKILIDEAPDPAHALGPGMSVVPEVKVR
jgi:membrane fusion protein (multidrug efflux system)